MRELVQLTEHYIVWPNSRSVGKGEGLGAILPDESTVVVSSELDLEIGAIDKGFTPAKKSLERGATRTKNN